MADYPQNPYLADKGQQIAALLMSLGQGITASDMAGRSPFVGLGLGAGLYGQSQAQANQLAQEWQNQEEARAFRDRQIGIQEAELRDKQAERARAQAAAEGWVKANSGGVPGFAPPTPQPVMGPGPAMSLSPNPNNIGNVRPSGANEGFQQPESFDDGVRLTVNNARAYPDKFNNGQPMTLEQIASRWTPGGVGGNPPDAPQNWARNVSLTSGIPLGQPVDLSNPDTAARFARGVHVAEWGGGNAKPLEAYIPGVQMTQATGGRAAPPSRGPQYAEVPTGPPVLQEPPRPTQLPPDVASYLNQLVMTRAITPEQAETKKQQILGEMHSSQKEAARARYQQETELYKWQRDREADGEWVRGSDGVERFVSKAQRKPGMTRSDKPKDAGTHEGDIAILAKGDIASPEYLAAYNRLSQKWHDIGGGQKIREDMSAYGRPTYVAPNAAEVPKPEGQKAYTETQNKDHTYATRLADSIPQLENLLFGGGKFDASRIPSSSAWKAANSDYVPDSMVSENVKEYRRIAKDIVTATLRRESGASISPSEFTSEYAKFIPQAGDSEKIARQKLEALKVAARTIAEGTGRPIETYGKGFDRAQAAEGDAKTISIDLSGRRK